MARKQLNKAERFFVEHHATQMSVDELAQELSVLASIVAEYLKELNKGKKPRAKPKKLANFETKKGVVAMTGEQAMDDDAAKGNSPFLPTKAKPNKEFYDAHRENLHKIRPNEPFQ